MCVVIKYIQKSFLVLTLLAFIQVRSQGGARIKDNNLDNSKNLTISSTIFGIDTYNPNLNLFLDGKIQYRFKKETVWLNAQYKVAWADRLDEVTTSSSSQEAVPVEGTKPLKSYGLSVGYNFIKREDYKVARATFMNRSQSKSIRLPVKSYRLYGVHGGYDYFRSVVAQGSTMSYSGAIVADYPRDTIVNVNHATPMFHMNMISIGIHRQKIQHYEIEVVDGGSVKEYKSKMHSIVYADFLIGTAMTLDNILIPLNGAGQNANPNYTNDPFNFYRVDVNNSYKKIPVGGRIGWEQVTLGTVGTSFGIEFGFRPGILGPDFNTYLLFKYGISFNFKAK